MKEGLILLFDATVTLAGSPFYPKDWLPLGHNYDVVRWFLVNNSGGNVTVTPELTDVQPGVEYGPNLPEPVIVPDGEQTGMAYNTDLLPAWWRFRLLGTGSVTFGVTAKRR